MDCQTIFDKVARHLLKQRKKSMRKFGCAYRGDNGLRCAIGCLIPDKHYSDEIENKGVKWEHEASSPLGRALRASVGRLSGRKIKLMASLQETHDDVNASEWRGKLRSVAAEFGLSAKACK